MSKGFQEGEGQFNFANGDKYEGHYCAHVSGVAWRQGFGRYTTHDGQIYEGTWKDDKLNEGENVQIQYQNNDVYYGKINKYKYNNGGTYTFSNGGRLSANFSNNKPLGDIIYIDHHDNLWHGKAEDEDVILAREHIFSYELDSQRGKGKPKYKDKLLDTTTSAGLVNEDEESIDMKEVERILFAKSFQTPSHVDFKDSNWIRNYEKNIVTQKIVLDKLKLGGPGSLNDTEKIWYRHYYYSVKALQNHNVKRLKKIKNDLLKQHFEDEAKNTCPPPRVLYPQPYQEQATEG